MWVNNLFLCEFGVLRDETSLRTLGCHKQVRSLGNDRHLWLKVNEACVPQRLPVSAVHGRRNFSRFLFNSRACRQSFLLIIKLVKR